MEDKIPLPTDNIYKFYALFGLALFIFCAGAVIYIVRTSNDLVFRMNIELATVKQIAKPLDADIVKEKFLEAFIKGTVTDRKFFTYVLGGFFGLAMCSMFYGFKKWHKKVQPIQDEMLKLQVEKLRYEVKALKFHSHD